MERFVETFTEALQSTCRKTFKTISTENRQKRRNQSADGRTVSLSCGKG